MLGHVQTLPVHFSLSFFPFLLNNFKNLSIMDYNFYKHSTTTRGCNCDIDLFQIIFMR